MTNPPPRTIPTARPPASGAPAPATQLPRRGDAIDQWLSMFVRFLRLPHEQSRSIKDELDSHMRERVRDLMLEGLSEDEGMRRAIDELGEAAELAAHFRAAHRPNRRMLMSIAAIGVAAGAAVISVVALTQTQTVTEPPMTKVAIARDLQRSQHEMTDSQDGAGVELTKARADGVLFVSDLPLIGRLFVPSQGADAWGATTPPAKINGKVETPTIRTLAALLAEGKGRLLLNVGEADIDKPLKSVEFVDADTATVLRVLNDRAGLSGPHRLDVRYRGDVVEIAPVEQFDRVETALVAYDLTEAMKGGAKVEDLTRTITTFVEHDGWHDNGGETAYFRVVSTKMFVQAPPRYHEQLVWILKQFSPRAAAPAPFGGGGAGLAPAPAAGAQNDPPRAAPVAPSALNATALHAFAGQGVPSTAASPTPAPAAGGAPAGMPGAGAPK